ncbi:gamma-glutamylaminecyclotransferase-like isoform X2 [Pomacea canaliculata]|uniref:gamma-glutamylaminecyclotransferase-like isoform X2 n=1 Tax=Pomacea canaliculata TaxID=400727 RepID=UPI000D72E91A|nr:gamma-glutamylaminecyclotransferase-like isoform X2 [Pomacea canaliculata]
MLFRLFNTVYNQIVACHNTMPLRCCLPVTVKGSLATWYMTEHIGRRINSSNFHTMGSKGELIFCYGTLKKGQPNNKIIIDETTGHAKFICQGRIKHKYPLIIASQYNIPFLLYAEGKGYNVQGDVYEVDEQKRDFLDDFEGHPTYYERMLTEIVVDEENAYDGEKLPKTLMCWVYFLKDFNQDMLDLQFYQNYDSFGSHGQRYVERYLRPQSADETIKKYVKC